MSKIVQAAEAWYRQHGIARVAPSHRPENTSQGIRKYGFTWMHLSGPQTWADGYRKGRAPLRAKSALLASALSIKSASIFRAREAGTRAFKMRFSRPGMTLERFLRRPPRASDTHCSTLSCFIGMVLGPRPNFSRTAVFVNPAASTVTQTPRGLNS